MSAELLREAARLMRERAGKATPGPWLANVLGSEGYAVTKDRDLSGPPRRRIRVARCGHEDWDTDKHNAEHIASWHPAVSLDVADLLKHVDGLPPVSNRDCVSLVGPDEPCGQCLACSVHWLRNAATSLARAYLGGIT